MPRVIVTTDPSRIPEHVSVLLDERVHTVHLSSDHGAAGLIERIAWAISDAEDAEEASVGARAGATASSTDRGAGGHAQRGPRGRRARPQLAVVAS